jgi:heterodisulfide reductase subunit A
MFACADSTQKEIASDINDNQLDAIVVASCSPKLHLYTFRDVASRSGLNPYNYIQVNIREQCSWAHSNTPVEATAKAIKMINAGIARAKYSEALTPINIPAINTIAVVGAGVSGLCAAIEMANMGSVVYLIERDHFVGGRTSQWGELFITGQRGEAIIEQLYEEVAAHENITLFTGAEIISKKGSVGDFQLEVLVKPRLINTEGTMDQDGLNKAINACPAEFPDAYNFGLTSKKAIYKNKPGQYPQLPAIDASLCTYCEKCLAWSKDIDLNQKEKKVELNVGAVLLSTGFDPYEPQKGEYGYGEIDNVITLQQLKRLIELNGDKLTYNGRDIHNIGFIYCVGSRQVDGDNKYCSRYCCTAAIHTANVIKKKYEDIQNLHFTRGVRTYGKQEMLYEESAKNGDIYFQSYEEDPPIVKQNGQGTTVVIKDFLTNNMELESPIDLVVLVTGMVPRKVNEIGKIMKAPVGRDKFFNEIHPKLRPVETVIEGVHICGTCQAPVNITESVKSSLSAASKANSLVSSGSIELEPTLAKIDEDTCKLCDACFEACPFDAITKTNNNGQSVAKIIEANCKGCGMCLPVCEKNAIELLGYKDIEIEHMIDALID